MAIAVTSTRKVPLGELRPYPRNPRCGDTEAIAESLRAHGQYRPVVVRHPSYEVLAGNHVYFAAGELGWEELLCSFVECDDEGAARIVLVDNRLSELGNQDAGLLASLLQDLDGLAGTGYSEADLQKLLRETDAAMDLDRDVCPECQRPL